MTHFGRQPVPLTDATTVTDAKALLRKLLLEYGKSVRSLRSAAVRADGTPCSPYARDASWWDVVGYLMRHTKVRPTLFDYAYQLLQNEVRRCGVAACVSEYFSTQPQNVCATVIKRACDRPVPEIPCYNDFTR